MTAPSDPPEAPEFHEEEQEIVLRLGDILPRVPPHLLKPGPHDISPEIRFSVEELAAKISRGRVSVPLQRLSSVCPNVFRDSSAFPGEQEVPLPLQKLLDQVGLVSSKTPTGNSIPAREVARARAEAARIIETRDAAPAAPEPEQPAPEISKPEPTPSAPPTSPTPPAAAPESTQPAQGSGIAKALSTARQFLGLFGKPSEPARREEPRIAELQPAAVSTPPEPVPESNKPAIPPLEPLTPTSSSEPGPASPPVPAGCISLRARPVFALLSPPILKPGPLPEESARVTVPLALVEPQLASGHVEIPVGDFVNGLPEELRVSIDPISGALVWIPLDEVFQNLPKDHLFYMPAFDSIEPVAPSLPETPAVIESAEPATEKPAEPEPIAENKVEPPAIVEEKITPPEPAAVEPPPPPVIEPAPENPAPEPPAPIAAAEPEAAPVASVEHVEATALVAPPEPIAPVSSDPPPEPIAPVSSDPPPEPIAPVSSDPPPAAVAPDLSDLPPPPVLHAVLATPPPLVLSGEAPSPAEPAPPQQQPAAQMPPRAPWMRGFQVPPPRLFIKRQPAAPGAPAQAEAPGTLPPSTPEAKRTADFLASQPGIFAAAAFVESAVFSSSDFPHKPDLEALREFMSAFVSCARESGERLGWKRVIRMPCDNFHLTAVVRDNHFLVALHHDRNLSTLAYDTLISAADELSKSGA